ncbi:MAG TPA: DnaJ domain-containing protein [Patescibacteria group bacterium]|jgi:curved DNA-binding protein CbpA|nr:DnaJ domain-containing protein [Patescibacteria group bacterium]
MSREYRQPGMDFEENFVEKLKKQNFYERFQVSSDAPDDVIKSAYIKLSKAHHPDKSGFDEYFKLLNEAFEVLGDEVKRAEYDKQNNFVVAEPTQTVPEQDGVSMTLGEETLTYKPTVKNFESKIDDNFNLRYAGYKHAVEQEDALKNKSDKE